jgi:small subunit ribosomal protein S20
VVKNVREAIASGDQERADAALKSATSTLDKAAGKGVIHHRTAGRKISRLNKAVNKIG